LFGGTAKFPNHKILQFKLIFHQERMFVMYYYWYNYTVYQPIPHSQEIYQSPYAPMRPYPPTDPTILSETVKEFQTLMQQSELLLNKLSDTDYSTELMDAAQEGNQTEVDRLIQSINALHVPVQIRYTPSGVIFNLESPAVSQGANCCRLEITLKWGR